MTKNTATEKEEKKKDIMRKAFDCFCKHGLNDTSVKLVAQACNMAIGNLYNYFKNFDDLILQSTAFCMGEVEDEFMQLSPKSPDELERFIDEIPRWTAINHGAKYRFMYQVYTSPKYLGEGKKFFQGVTKRYCEYAKILEKLLHIPYNDVQAFIFFFVRACVHYALFGEEDYLTSQTVMLKKMLKAMYQYRDLLK
ncbi:MAG: TetR/AcrR family transcriptional regulator [Clostridia bacterium]|nr:TetR/AcrR family transcriptional regulator [Clostridia bacterium]